MSLIYSQSHSIPHETNPQTLSFKESICHSYFFTKNTITIAQQMEMLTKQALTV